MKIICAETLLLGKTAFEHAGETIVIPDREISREDLLDADALVIRSKTKVTPELLEGTSVQFVGTGTAGTDHLNLPWLEQHGIYSCAAPGCNANSVSEYLIAGLLTLGQRQNFNVEGKTIGIIGYGNVGRRVAAKAEALGLTVLRNDPPLETATSDPDFTDLASLLAQADIVTMHVPLVREKPWPTYKMADYLFFEKMKPGAIFINASRGDVVDYDAFLLAKQSAVISQAIIDVWDPEPAFRTDVVAAADLASVHIAGHSYEGKLNGTINVYNELCNFFEIEHSWNIEKSLPKPAVPQLTVDAANRPDEEVLHEIIQQIYDIRTDDGLIRAAALPHTAERAAQFDHLRKNYRIRREFNNTTVHATNASPTLKHKIKALGFRQQV